MADLCDVASFGWVRFPCQIYGYRISKLSILPRLFLQAVNDKDEDPCTVASELISLCGTPGIPNFFAQSGISGCLLIIPAFTLQPLENGDTYPPPTVEDQNPCVCSSVVYALVSVCSACQHGHNGRYCVLKYYILLLVTKLFSYMKLERLDSKLPA